MRGRKKSFPNEDDVRHLGLSISNGHGRPEKFGEKMGALKNLAKKWAG
jgi:hypothetical protein